VNILVLESDMHESKVVSDLMMDFPPISKEDNPEVLAAYVMTHFEQTSDIINYNAISETMSGTPLIVESKRKSRKKSMMINKRLS